MAQKGNTPGKDKMDSEKQTGTKRRYQSPQTPPQVPRSRTQGKEQVRQQDGHDVESEDYGQDQEGQQHDHQARDTQQQDRQGSRQVWHDTQDEVGGKVDEVDGEVDGELDAEWAGRGSDFDLQKASRDELNAIAVELDIEDYETMNREELVSEIRERS